MKFVKTLNNVMASTRITNCGCGECQTSCQSACKTSSTVANQLCEKIDKIKDDKK